MSDKKWTGLDIKLGRGQRCPSCGLGGYEELARQAELKRGSEAVAYIRADAGLMNAMGDDEYETVEMVKRWDAEDAEREEGGSKWKM